MKKFSTPLAIEGTEQELRSLIDDLLKLGYTGSSGLDFSQYNRFLVTNRWKQHDVLGVYNESSASAYGRTIVPAKNRELVLALAAMVEGDEIHVGEILVLTKGGYAAKLGALAKVIEEGSPYLSVNWIANGKGQQNGRYGLSNFRKATKEEIIEHFGESIKVENATPAKETDFPKNWVIKRDKSNYKEINKWFNEQFPDRSYTADGSKTVGWQEFDYLHYPQFASKTVYTTKVAGYEEITIEQFREHVLKQPKMYNIQELLTKRIAVKLETEEQWKKLGELTGKSTTRYHGNHYYNFNKVDARYSVTTAWFEENDYTLIDFSELNFSDGLIGYESPMDLFDQKVLKGEVYVSVGGKKEFWRPSKFNDNQTAYFLPKEIVETWKPVYKKREATIKIGTPNITVKISATGGINIVEYPTDGVTISDIHTLISQMKTPKKTKFKSQDMYYKTPVVHFGCDQGPDITLAELESIVTTFNSL